MDAPKCPACSRPTKYVVAWTKGDVEEMVVAGFLGAATALFLALYVVVTTWPT